MPSANEQTALFRTAIVRILFQSYSTSYLVLIIVPLINLISTYMMRGIY
jgi:hypothetical protein